MLAFLFSIYNMNRIVFVEGNAEVGSLIAAYLAKLMILLMSLLSRVVFRADIILTTQPSGFTGYYASVNGMTICRVYATAGKARCLLTSLDGDMNHILALGRWAPATTSQNHASTACVCWRVCAYICGKANKRNRQKSSGGAYAA